MALAFLLFLPDRTKAAPAVSRKEDSGMVSRVMDQYCAGCHNAEKNKGEIDLEKVSGDDITLHTEIWEKVVRRLRTRQMPPPDKKRPDENTYQAVLAHLESSLDAAADRHPNPGRTETFRRLNRTEYQNAIRDLLALDIDAATLLPKEEGGHGFDNVTVGNLSPTLLDRYISAAQKISRVAVGTARRPGGETIRIRPDLTQEEQVPGLPVGTRGGALIPFTFPQDAEYEIQIRLARDRNEEVEGLHETHELEVLLDREMVKSFTVAPPKGHKNFETVDQHLKIRLPVSAGPHQLGITFVKHPSELLETKRQPYQAHFNVHRHPRISPALYQVSINGPYAATGPGETPSRQRIFISQPRNKEEEEPCARKILSAILRRAYRRPIEDADLEKPMDFFRRGRLDGGFDGGIEAAISAILVSPQFLFRVERDPEKVAPGTAYPLNDFELASRLSFFLWSSIPDDTLLDAAERGQLGKRAELERQVRRMLKDPRSRSLVSNFAGQWLYLRNLESFTPDLRLFPDFDDNLRQALREETELFFESILKDDSSVLTLLRADYTYLNERLAKHYGIPFVYGSRFRRVQLRPSGILQAANTLPGSLAADSNSSEAAAEQRGGLLRQGSILTVTSYPTRTSPVIRGHWILANLLGVPPPPPPPNVPALKENTVSATLSVRERLSAHRSNSACAGCHNLMDPVGFSLENFDALGRWRAVEEGQPIDASGALPDGRTFTGVAGLENGLLSRPEILAGTLTEKLLTFALGRGLETYDAAAVRTIVRESETNGFRFSSIIAGVVSSRPFTMRRSL